jgi:hypothetical protein
MNGHKVYFTIKYFNGVYIPVSSEALNLFYQVLTLVKIARNGEMRS